MIGARPVVAALAAAAGFRAPDAGVVGAHAQVTTLAAGAGVADVLAFQVPIIGSVAHGR
jgi:hypothetical protein